MVRAHLSGDLRHAGCVFRDREGDGETYPDEKGGPHDCEPGYGYTHTVSMAADPPVLSRMVAQTSDPASSEPAGTIATGEVDGRSVVVYKADTMGHFDIFRIEAMGFSTQAEAFDLDTGERIWDRMLMAEFGGTDADVLGMGAGYFYVRSVKGLLILDAGTGEIVASDDGVREVVLAKHGWFGLPW